MKSEFVESLSYQWNVTACSRENTRPKDKLTKNSKTTKLPVSTSSIEKMSKKEIILSLNLMFYLKTIKWRFLRYLWLVF